MGLKSFIYYLDQALKNRIREEIQIEKGEVKNFVIQYEAYISDEWHPVARYDTAHGFAHLDLYQTPRQKRKFEVHTKDFNEALTYAEKDLEKNWMKYRESYETHYTEKK
ncbi:MAG: hypothetical protein ACE5IW_08405 [bacterium]